MTEDDAVREALAAYEVGEELGRGAFGVVLAARHRQLGREVAVKQLPRELGADPSVRRRFLEEARTLAAMDHPHIVPIFDFVEHDGLCLLVMERLTGGTLWSRMYDTEIDPEEVCALGVQAAAGLHYAHQRGVLHRDVKPENLMFSGAGVLKVTDFGIAKVLGGDLSMATKAGYTLGTPDYMAPEQAQGLDLTPAVDVYALGTVLYEVLAGRRPFPDQGDPLASLYQRVHEEPPPLSAVAESVAGPVGEVVDRALARRLEDRFASTGDLGEALARAAEQVWGRRPTPSGPMTPLPLAAVGAAPRSGTAAERRSAPTTPTPVVGDPLAPPRGGETSATGPAPVGAAPPARRPAPPRRLVVGLAVAVAVLLAVVAAAVLGGGDGDGGGTATPEDGAASTTVSDAPVADAGFAVDPSAAPVGGTVTVRSLGACPAPPAGVDGPQFVYLTIVDPRSTSADFEVYGRQFPVQPDRSWSAEVEVPPEASAGEVSLRASCFGLESGYDYPGPYYDYPLAVPFTVAGG